MDPTNVQKRISTEIGDIHSRGTETNRTCGSSTVPEKIVPMTATILKTETTFLEREILKTTFPSVQMRPPNPQRKLQHPLQVK